MQGASSTSDSKQSSKTPGGISKSLLTPCRRVGLSKKWKRVGSSPFVSPLSGENSTPDRIHSRQTRKRVKYGDGEISVDSCETSIEHDHNANPYSPQPYKKPVENNAITITPSRHTQIPRKLSKNLSSSLKDDDINSSEETNSPIQNVHIEEEKVSKDIKQISEENVSKPYRTNSRNKTKLPLIRNNSSNYCSSELMGNDTKAIEKSPNNLIKECMVVIENRILKADKRQTKSKLEKLSKDSDLKPDVSLSISKKKTATLNTSNDDDFIPTSTEQISSINNVTESHSSQEDIDEKTILIKKSYDKVIKPSRAKSTGSITQKDIDALTARIERKKNLLLAKAMSIDTEELRNLIKKWQKGCQDALIELLDLMKKKLSVEQNMDYAELLQYLRIPAELVGYDVENDCFVTPDDTNILLSAFKL